MRINQTILIICFLWTCAAHTQQSEIDSLENFITKNTRDLEMANALSKLSGIYGKRDTEIGLKYAWRAKTLAKFLEIGVTLTTKEGYINLSKGDIEKLFNKK